MKISLIFLLIISIKSLKANNANDDGENLFCPQSTFDTAVSINECYALLFKRNLIWLFDVCNFQLITVYNLHKELLKCFPPSSINATNAIDNNRIEQPQQQQQQLFAWNRMKKISPYNHYHNAKNFICLELNNEICYFPIIITKQYPSEEYLKTIGNINSMENEIFRNLCQSDVIIEEYEINNNNNNNGQTSFSSSSSTLSIVIIEMAHMYYHVSTSKGSKIYRLNGKNFYADIVWTPSSYDWNRLIFSVKLYKLIEQQYNNNNDNDNKNGRPEINDNNKRPDFEPEYFILDNVSTFLIMPTDIEVMIFFNTNEFCIVNYFTKNCGRRSTKDLFGCVDDYDTDYDDDDRRRPPNELSNGTNRNDNNNNNNRPHNMTIVNIFDSSKNRSSNEPLNNSMKNIVESLITKMPATTTTTTTATITSTVTTAKTMSQITLDNLKNSDDVTMANEMNRKLFSEIIPTTTTTTTMIAQIKESIMENISNTDSIINDNNTNNNNEIISFETSTSISVPNSFESTTSSFDAIQSNDQTELSAKKQRKTSSSSSTTMIIVTTDNDLQTITMITPTGNYIATSPTTVESKSILCNNKNNNNYDIITTTNESIKSNSSNSNHEFDNNDSFTAVSILKTNHNNYLDPNKNKSNHGNNNNNNNQSNESSSTNNNQLNDDQIFSKDITCDIDCVLLKAQKFSPNFIINYDQDNRKRDIINENGDNSDLNRNHFSMIIKILLSNEFHHHFLRNGSILFTRIILRGLKFCCITLAIVGILLILILSLLHYIQWKNFRADIFSYIMLSFFTQKLKQT